MSKVNTPQPWERQPDEGLKPYDAFCIYRDMETQQRSVRKVGEQLGKSLTLVGRWSSKFSWVERAKAWDDEQDRRARDAQITEIKEMRKKHVKIAEAMLVKAAKALARLPEDEINAMDISRMVDTASKLERISRGDTGEVIETRDGGKATPAVTFYMPSNSRENMENEDDE